MACLTIFMPLKCSNQGILGGAASVLFFFWFGRMPPEPNCGAVCVPFFFGSGECLPNQIVMDRSLSNQLVLDMTLNCLKRSPVLAVYV